MSSRVLSVLLCAFGIAWCSAAKAATFATPGEAYSACQSAGAAAVAYMNSTGRVSDNFRCVHQPSTPPTGRYYCEVHYDQYGTSGNWYIWNGCHNAAQDAYYDYTGACPDGSPATAAGCPIDCDALNNDPETAPGPGLYLDETVGDKCVGGCKLGVVGDPLGVVHGRVQGQPRVFYRFNRHYTGETCDGTDPPDESEFSEPNEDDKVCNPSAGVCVTPDGETEYCTFNPDGTPSSCVPAVDYDNDGIHDDDDADPADPQDSNDDGEGDESDNTASGGVTCQTAPACSGDGIACATLYQQWKTRCAVENLEIKVTVGGGGPGQDNGDPFDKASEAQALNNAYTEGDGLDGISPDDAWLSGQGAPSFSTSRFGGGGGCPAFPQFEIAGYAFQRPAAFCDVVAVIRLILLAAGFVYCASIVLRA